MQPPEPFDSPDPWSTRPPARPANRRALAIAAACVAVLLLGLVNAQTHFISKALGLGPRPPIAFRANLVTLAGDMVRLDIRARDARDKAVKKPGSYLKRPRIEILNEDRQVLASIRLEAG